MVTGPTISAVGQVPDDVLDPYGLDPGETGTEQIEYTRWHPRRMSFDACINSLLLREKWSRASEGSVPDYVSVTAAPEHSAEEAVPRVWVNEWKSVGFSEGVRSQLERLCGDIRVVTNALGSPSPHWLFDLTPLVYPGAIPSSRILSDLFRRSADAAMEHGAHESEIASDGDYPEWDWIQRNRTWLEERYAGLWIAVVGHQLVAVADSPADLLEQTEGFERPFMYHVPAESEPAVVATGKAGCRAH